MYDIIIYRILSGINEKTRKEKYMKFENLLVDFMQLVKEGQVEVYNEFSLQHELGIYLRANLKGYKVQFERNTKFFGIKDTVKHEIDIVIYDESEKYAIELKYPLNGQYPEQMFSFVKDIKFMEEIKEQGFDSTYCLTLVKDKNFYSGKKMDGIYAFFRDDIAVNGLINKPTGKRDEQIQINGTYDINWEACDDKRYFIITID